LKTYYPDLVVVGENKIKKELELIRNNIS